VTHHKTGLFHWDLQHPTKYFDSIKVAKKVQSKWTKKENLSGWVNKQVLLKKWIGGCYVKSAIADPVTALEREREREREEKRNAGGYVFKC
jgi:hypothetical protein